MGKTTNFGLNFFGPEGRITDEGNKFSDTDRKLIDALLYTLFNHDHQSVSQNSLDGPAGSTPPTLTVNTTGGTLPPGRIFYYKFSYRDRDGNETAASVTGSANTPAALVPPAAPALSTATTGGTLPPGTYRYALSYYQTNGETTAPNIATIVVPVGTNTNTVTLTLPALASGATGWKIYRRAPNEQEFWLLDSETTGPTYVDDGTVNPDCTKRRKTSNTTNSTNSITVEIPSSELPLDSRVGSWRVYRSSTGLFSGQNLVATVSQTTTQGGADLITSYTDTGAALGSGIPLQQSSVPPVIPQLDAARVFGTGRLPSDNAPRGVSAYSCFLPGTIAAGTYNQFYANTDMPLAKVSAFFKTGPTGVDSSNFVTIRVSDNSLVDEIQSLWNDAIAVDEIQYLSNTATSGTFTLSDGVDTTDPIAYNATAATIETRLETDITSITDVTVSGAGTSSSPWIITFINPGSQNVTELTVDDTNLVGGASTIYTSVEGSDGGTFTLSDGVDTTDPIAYNATAATIETRLETDITSITDVTVSGVGTEADPWIITFVNPGDIDVGLLVVDDGLLNGISTITEEVKGRSGTTFDLVCSTEDQLFYWDSPATSEGEGEAEDGTGGLETSDLLAGNDVSMELDAQSETNYFDFGTLEEGTYLFRFYVSNVDQNSTFEMSVIDNNGPTTLDTFSTSSARIGYTPAYEIELSLDGTEDIRVQVEKTDAGAGRVRIDRYEYEVQLPTLYANQLVTVEALIDGTPTTNGDDVNLTLWY